MRDCPKSFGSTGQSFCATLSCHCSWLRTFRLDQRSVQRSVALSRDLRRPSRHYAGVRDRSLRRRTASPVAACRQARRGVEGRIGHPGRHISLQRRIHRITSAQCTWTIRATTYAAIFARFRPPEPFWVALGDDREGGIFAHTPRRWPPAAVRRFRSLSYP